MPYKWYSEVKLAVKVLKLGGKYISIKYCKCNSFQVISDLINSDNLQLAFAQLCTELQVYNYTMS